MRASCSPGRRTLDEASDAIEHRPAASSLPSGTCSPPDRRAPATAATIRRQPPPPAPRASRCSSSSRPRKWAERTPRRAPGIRRAAGRCRAVRKPRPDAAGTARGASWRPTGLSNREIAERLFLSPRTIGAHLYTAFRKLGISSAGAARRAHSIRVTRRALGSQRATAPVRRRRVVVRPSATARPRERRSRARSGRPRPSRGRSSGSGRGSG